MTGRLDQLIARWTARKAAAMTAPEREGGDSSCSRACAASQGVATSDQAQQVMASVLRSLRDSVAAGEHHPHQIVNRFCRQFKNLVPAASRLIGADWASDALEAIKERDRPAPEPSGAGRDDPSPSLRTRLLASAGDLVLDPKLRFASG